MASGRVAPEAIVYPFQFCQAISEGCVSQLEKDGKTTEHLHGIQDCLELEPSDPGEILAMNGMKTAKVFRDAVAGQLLDEALVRAARRWVSTTSRTRKRRKTLSVTGQLLTCAQLLRCLRS